MGSKCPDPGTYTGARNCSARSSTWGGADFNTPMTPPKRSDSGNQSSLSAPHLPLERFKKLYNCFLIFRAQFFKAPCDIARFATVAENGIAKRE
jgi:hypothetical protein